MVRSHILLMDEDEQRAAQRARDLEVRAGGFVDGRPPSDLDKLETFTFSEMPLVGQLLLGTGGFLFLALVVFLLVA